MRAAVEPFSAALPELLVLGRTAWAEVGLLDLPYDPDTAGYLDLERAGLLLFVGLRERGALVGYLSGFLRRHLHSKGCLTLYGDMVYVRPEARGRFGFRRLLRAAEAECKRRGVVVKMFGSTALNPQIGQLLELHGYRATETIYAKGR